MAVMLSERPKVKAQTVHGHIDRKEARLFAEIQAMQIVRHARKGTHAYTADLVRATRGDARQVQPSNDILLSVLRSAIESIGGTLELTLRFENNERIEISLKD